MRYSTHGLVGLGLALALAGCSDDVRTIRATPAPTATVAMTEVPATATEAMGTATVTPQPTSTATEEVPTGVPTLAPTPGEGPVVSHLGIATAENRPVESIGNDASGRPVFELPLGTGLNLIIEGRPGGDGFPVGINAYEPDGLPDLQVLLSQALGDGSAEVCDVEIEGVNGGVPAIDPPVFSDTGAAADAVNDLGCRVNDGTGRPVARQSSAQACTQFESGDFSFVEPTSQAQFCLPIARAWAFPQGDTVVTARLRSLQGNLGPTQQIVVRILRDLPPLTPGPTPIAPRLTHLGLAAADDRVLEPAAFDGEGRPIYTRLFGHAFSLIVEGGAGFGGLDVGVEAFDAEGFLPDLQVLVERDLGDGAMEVCDVDVDAGEFGGVPGVPSLGFSEDQEVVDAINDLGCRVNDGTGQTIGRPPAFPCTRDGFGNFAFVDPTSSVQFCLPIAKAWEFQRGDTIVAARIRSIDGELSEVAEIVVRVDDEDLSNDCEAGGLGPRIFSVDVGESSLMTTAAPGIDALVDGVAESAVLCAGPSDDDVYPLRFLEDFAVGLRFVDDSVICIGFDASQSDGVLDCSGRQALDVVESLDRFGERELMTELGVPSGSGAAMIELEAFFRTMPAGFDPNECATLSGFMMPVALTTANAESQVADGSGGVLSVSADGIPFDCANWSAEDGAGAFTLPIGALATFAGNVANVFTLSD